jgi:hypothetical protein
MALFVLGAGATSGASFVNPANNPCLPPLDLKLCAHVIPFPNGDLVPFPNGDLVRADDASSMIFSETSSTSDQH